MGDWGAACSRLSRSPISEATTRRSPRRPADLADLPMQESNCHGDLRTRTLCARQALIETEITKQTHAAQAYLTNKGRSSRPPHPSAPPLYPRSPAAAFSRAPRALGPRHRHRPRLAVHLPPLRHISAHAVVAISFVRGKHRAVVRAAAAQQHPRWPSSSLPSSFRRSASSSC
jgi:hypothetical protein